MMLVTDSSGSMQATDVTPDRLTPRARRRRTFAERLPEKFRLGLVTFTAVAGCSCRRPRTASRCSSALDGLQAAGGTAIGDALETSLTEPAQLIEAQPRRPATERGARRGEPPAVVVLLSDG